MVEDVFTASLAADFPELVALDESAVLIRFEIALEALDRAQALGLRLAGVDGYRSDPDGVTPMLDYIIDLSSSISEGLPAKHQFDSARQIFKTWGEGPDLIELVLLEPL
ncbi:hypothetical protein NicSoilE8_05190 [Arthrobacter sp. NicSoilE8]|nr:hypothetical protein NicSoilE8_05190 [Arthrobacter sp. NicSoilE8]